MVQAEVTLDGSMGFSGKLAGPAYEIEAEYGQQAGANLFHSFNKFNLNSEEAAIFKGPSSIENIIGRVTGGEISRIDGLLQSQIDQANLFLLNPNGIIFGENAKLDITGSFYPSSADYLRFKDGTTFDTNHPANSVLTSEFIEAFGFLGENPGDITIEENNILSVPYSKSFSIIGGNIDISNSSIQALDGQINIASINSAGEVNLEHMNIDDFSDLGEIKIRNGSLLNSSGNQGGEIFIRGGKFEIDNSAIKNYNFGDGNGGIIDINLKEDLILSNQGLVGTICSAGTGDAADIIVKANTISLNNYSRIISGSLSSGNAGDIKIDTSKLYVNSGSRLTSSTVGEEMTGNAGNIAINADHSVIVTGRTKINDSTKTSLISSDTGNYGKGGNIDISAPLLKINDNAKISALTMNAGNAGNIIFDVENFELTNGGLINALTGGKGNAGNIDIKASSSLKISNSRLFAAAYSEGDGGSIQIESEFMDMYDSSICVRTQGAGNAGTFDLNSGDLIIGRDSKIDGDTFSTGKGGSISINTDTLTIKDGGQIRANTQSQGDGGDINISSENSISVFGFGNDLSAISAITSEGALGNGGNVTISSRDLTISELGSIFTTSTSGGDAGDININVQKFSLLNGSQVSANSIDGGKPGDVLINAADSIIISGYNTMLYGDTLIGSATIDSNNYSSLLSEEAGTIKLMSPEIAISKGALISGATGSSNKGSNIEIITDSLLLEHGGQINSTGFMAKGEGGDITIKATESIVLSGHDEITDFASIISSSTFSEGKAGNINLDTSKLVIKDDCHIAASTRYTGHGGSIIIFSSNIDINGGSISADTSGTGKGGEIHINTECLNISAPGSITTNVDYFPQINPEIGLNNIDITGTGLGGNITINASKSVYIHGIDENKNIGLITALTEGQGNGGTINITSPDLIVNQGTIFSGTFPNNKENGRGGDAGAINLNVDRLVIEYGGQINGKSTRDQKW